MSGLILYNQRLKYKDTLLFLSKQVFLKYSAGAVDIHLSIIIYLITIATYL